MIRAVGTAIDAIIGEVQWRENHNAVSIKIFFDLFRQSIHFLIFFLNIAIQQHCSLSLWVSPLRSLALFKISSINAALLFVLFRIG